MFPHEHHNGASGLRSQSLCHATTYTVASSHPRYPGYGRRSDFGAARGHTNVLVCMSSCGAESILPRPSPASALKMLAVISWGVRLRLTCSNQTRSTGTFYKGWLQIAPRRSKSITRDERLTGSYRKYIPRFSDTITIDAMITLRDDVGVEDSFTLWPAVANTASPRGTTTLRCRDALIILYTPCCMNNAAATPAPADI